MRDWRRDGLKTALLTLIGVDGSSPRPLGSQIAVAEDGRALGAITGGCAEQALVRDALDAMARGRNHVELYGEGSRFRDIVLPCGSGIHVAFDVTLDDRTLDDLIAARRVRQRAVYRIEAYARVYPPQARLVVIGQGHIVPALAQLAQLNEMPVIIYSPDEATRQRSTPFGSIHPLRSPRDCDYDLLDEATALVCLFHDHDYEAEILAAGLHSPAFYIGALGSRRTHVQRLEALRAQGFDAAALTRIHGPVGLDIGALTPPEIALSVMAEVVAAYRGLSSP
nr:XdhC family protein [Asticcacaulis aquaticus]